MQLSDEELFSDNPKITPIRDILSLGFEESWTLTDSEMARLKLHAGGTADIKTRGELTHRILEFIHIHSLRSSAITLVVLNRTFGKVANKFGTTTRDVTKLLMDNGRIEVFDDGNKRVMYSASVWKEQQAANEADGINAETVRANIIATAK